MTAARCWPTVPRVLERAASVTFDDDARCVHYVDRVTGDTLKVHYATALNLYNALKGGGWARESGGPQCTTFTRPTPAIPAP